MTSLHLSEVNGRSRRPDSTDWNTAHVGSVNEKTRTPDACNIVGFTWTTFLDLSCVPLTYLSLAIV